MQDTGTGDTLYWLTGVTEGDQLTSKQVSQKETLEQKVEDGLVGSV